MPNAFAGGDHVKMIVNLQIATHDIDFDGDAEATDLANAVIIPANAGAGVIPQLLERAWSEPYVRACLHSGRSYYFEGIDVKQRPRDGELTFYVFGGREIMLAMSTSSDLRTLRTLLQHRGRV